jgi:hypothetical protein
MKTISHTYKILPFVIFSLFSFSSKIMKGNEEERVVTYFAKKKKICKARKLTFPKTIVTPTEFSFETKSQQVYSNIDSTGFSMPEFKVFTKALKGFYALKAKKTVEKDIITIIDFSLSSNTKRLWVIDLNNNKVLYHSLVAHGKNTGEEFATSFSNKTDSNKSSLGFYATAETYDGKHGRSLRLDGLENGMNNNARSRGVVVHSADYVSPTFIKNHKRLGRSEGCPALPEELALEIIDVIKDKSCLFMYHPSMRPISQIC